MGHIKTTCFLIVIVCHLSETQFLDTLDLINRLETRFKTLNSTLAHQQKQIDAIRTDVLVQQLLHEDDIKTLTNRLKTKETTVSSLEKITKEHSEFIRATNLQVLGTEILLAEQASRIDTLTNANKMWKSNFKVVNRTFGELKKKLAIVVPVISLGS